MLSSRSRILALVAAGVLLLQTPPLLAQAQEPIRGDVDGDGRVTAADAQLVRAYLVGRALPDGRAILPAGDASGDGRVTAVDAAIIARFVAGQDVSRYPVGRRGGAVVPAGPVHGLGTYYECTVDVEMETTRCELSGTESTAGGPRLDLILGKPAVAFTSTNVSSSRLETANEDTTRMDVALVNNIQQPIGTVDGVNAYAGGSRIFFHPVPRVTSVKPGHTLASATIRVDNPTGTGSFSNPDGTFTSANKPFYQYDGVIAPGATHPAPKHWRFVYSASTKTFSYGVYVSAPVQFEYGWITLAPAAPVVGVGGTTPLTAASYDAAGTAMAAEAVTWSSGNPAVATVDASGVVTGVAKGTAVITATSDAAAQRTGSVTVTVDAAPSVVSTDPADGATDVAANSDIEISFSESVTVTATSFALECPAATAHPFSVSGAGSTYALTPGGDLPFATLCQVTVRGDSVKDADENDGPDTMAADYVFSFTTVGGATPDVYPDTLVGNVASNSASRPSPWSVVDNDQVGPATTISFAGWDGDASATEQGGTVTMTTSGASIGRFIYNPPAGYQGNDRFTYVLSYAGQVDTATVQLTVEGMIWFVDSNDGACAAACDGRMGTPFAGTAEYETARDAGGPRAPAAGDAVFLYESPDSYGSITLLAGQRLIGQDATATLEALAGVDLPPSSTLPAMDAANGVKATLGGTDGVNLGSGNALYGLTLATTAGEAIGGTAFGTLTLADGTTQAADVAIAAGGQALALNTGALSGTFASVGSTGGASNVSLTAVTGSLALAGTLSGATGTAIAVSGGSVGLTVTGNVTHAGSGALLSVGGGHTGPLAFSTGTLSATAGTGLRFDDVQGTYTFSGTTTLNGGDAGIDILNTTAGTFTFGTGTSVTTPSGPALYVYDSHTASITYNGTVTVNAGGSVQVGSSTSASCATVSFGGDVATSGTSTGVVVSGCDNGGIVFTRSLNVKGVGGMTVRGEGGAIRVTRS